LSARKQALEIAHGTTVMAVDVVVELEDEAILPRTIVHDEELLASDDELDIRFGRPDYKRMWVNEFLFRETLCKGDQLCGQNHRCVRCRAEWTRKKYKDSPSAERIAAHILYASQQPKWQSVEMDMISDFVNILYENLSFDKSLLKELSKFGAIRISQDKLVDEAVQENLELYEVWMAESGGQKYYMASYDPTNIVYASWFANILGEDNLPTTNCERLGDMVEAGLGFLYLATMFPQHMQPLMYDPTWMWRRIETSITSRRSWKSSFKFGKRKPGSSGPLVTSPAIRSIQQKLRAAPYVHNGALAGPKQAKERKGPRPASKPQTVVEQSETMTLMDLTRLCEFCGQGQKISDCVCEAGMLLRAVLRMTSGSSTESTLKEVNDLYEVVEESAKKRQNTRATIEGHATGSEGSGGRVM